jgi:hypothetical protein
MRTVLIAGLMTTLLEAPANANFYWPQPMTEEACEARAEQMRKWLEQRIELLPGDTAGEFLRIALGEQLKKLSDEEYGVWSRCAIRSAVTTHKPFQQLLHELSQWFNKRVSSTGALEGRP